MNTTTIEFPHPQTVPPKYKFGDRVAVTNDCQLEAWATSKVVGLDLEEYKFRPTTWCYIYKLDLPLIYTKKYSVDKLVFKSELSTLQVLWEIEANLASCPVCGESKTEPQTRFCADCNRKRW